MSGRDVRRAALRAALLAAVFVALLGAAALRRGARPSLADLMVALTAGLAFFPLALVEAAAARAAAAGRRVDVVARTWVLAVALLPLLALERAYVDATAFDAGMVAATDLLRRGALLPLMALTALVAAPIALAASIRVHRSSDLNGVGLLLLALVSLPLFCSSPLASFVLLLLANALVLLYGLADRLERRWRAWRDREPIQALRLRLERGEVSPAQAHLLAHLGDEVACGALGRADPDDGAPDPDAWAKGLLVTGPRLVARAALGAAGAALDHVDPRRAAQGLTALRAAAQALGATDLAAAPGADHAARARHALDGWPSHTPAERAVVEAVHAVVDRQPWCGVDAIRAAITATRDVEAVRAAIRAALEPHLGELDERELLGERS